MFDPSHSQYIHHELAKQVDANSEDYRLLTVDHQQKCSGLRYPWNAFEGIELLPWRKIIPMEPGTMSMYPYALGGHAIHS
jgi:hypothetical protein